MSVIGELIYKIKGDTKDFDKDIKGSQKTLKGFDKQITGLLVSLGAAGLTKSLLDTASAAEESANAISVVFGDAVSVIDEFGTVAAESAGLSKTAFNEAVKKKQGIKT